MDYERIQYQRPAGFLQTAVGRWLALAGASLVLVGAALLGAVLLIGILGLAIVAGTIIAGRIWWAKRKLMGRQPASGESSQVLEGEYTVVSKTRRQR